MDLLLNYADAAAPHVFRSKPHSFLYSRAHAPLTSILAVTRSNTAARSNLRTRELFIHNVAVSSKHKAKKALRVVGNGERGHRRPELQKHTVE